MARDNGPKGFSVQDIAGWIKMTAAAAVLFKS